MRTASRTKIPARAPQALWPGLLASDGFLSAGKQAPSDVADTAVKQKHRQSHQQQPNQGNLPISPGRSTPHRPEPFEP
jgi:hypothetical protein